MITLLIIILFIVFVISSKRLVDKGVIRDYRILQVFDILFIVAIIESFARGLK